MRDAQSVTGWVAGHVPTTVMNRLALQLADYNSGQY